jgi:phosphodiesterase/alkaline phosphatase D-like protein
MRAYLVCTTVLALGLGLLAGCGGTAAPEGTGSLDLNLQLADGVVINEVAWTISGNDMEPMTGTIDTSAPGATASVEVFGLPPGEDYLVELAATDESGQVTCRGDAEFDVEVGVATDVMVMLNCKRPTGLGGVRVNGEINICAQLAKVVVSPLQTSIGNDIDLSALGEDVEGDDISYAWSATGGSIDDASAQATTYTCEVAGEHTITITVSDDDGEYCMDDWTVSVTCVVGSSPEFPNGVAAGDVDQSSVVLWARATSDGKVRFEYGTDPSFRTADGCADEDVVIDRGDIIPSKAPITGLLAGTQYYYRACRGSCASAGEQDCQARGSFRTPHAGGRRGLRFGVSSCFEGRMRPFVSIRNVPARDLDFFVALGDVAYADHADACGGPAADLDDFRCKHRLAYQQWKYPDDNMFAQARASTVFFASIDDHEVVNDFAGGEGCNGDCYNDTDLFEFGLQAFEEYAPSREDSYGETGDPRTANERKLYRYRTFGKDAALFVLDARSFRDGPDAGQQVCDYADVLDKFPVCDYLEFEFESYQRSVTMLGSAQLQELLNDLSDAEDSGIIWKFILVPEPMQNLGPAGAPDRFEGYAHERAVILDFIEKNCIGNVVFISGDIHGTIANNLVYRPFFGGNPTDFLTTLRKYSSSWDISTGPGAYDQPFGDLISLAREPICAVAQVNDIIDGACGCDRGAYATLTTEGKAAAVEDFMDCVLGLLNYPKTGLSTKPQILLVPPYDPSLDSLRNAALPEKLLRGRYVATGSFGWTEFNIDDVTQKLYVTTYGVDPYELPSNNNGYSDEEAEDFLDRMPRIMSHFEVEPRCGCQELACLTDSACGKGCICDLIGCVLKNSVPTGELCADADACESGVCNGICVEANSVPLGDLCVAHAACVRGLCAGICLARCGDGFCDAARPEEECGRDNKGVSCVSDCGKCPTGHLCAGIDATCASGRCSNGRCKACLGSGKLCGRGGSCCSKICDTFLGVGTCD